MDKTILLLAAFGLTGVALTYVIAGPNSATQTPKHFYGQQFNQSDLEGSTAGKMQTLAVACDLSTSILPDLLNDGFVPYETSTIADVDKNVFVMTFWKRLSMNGYQMIITRTDATSTTCIISVSNNVQPVAPSAAESENSGETRDTLSGYVPI